jgi:hypothetical protein
MSVIGTTIVTTIKIANTFCMISIVSKVVWGRLSSRIPMSFPNRDRMLPVGWRSKKESEVFMMEDQLEKYMDWDILENIE